MNSCIDEDRRDAAEAVQSKAPAKVLIAVPTCFHAGGTVGSSYRGPPDRQYALRANTYSPGSHHGVG